MRSLKTDSIASRIELRNTQCFVSLTLKPLTVHLNTHARAARSLESEPTALRVELLSNRFVSPLLIQQQRQRQRKRTCSAGGEGIGSSRRGSSGSSNNGNGITWLGGRPRAASAQVHSNFESKCGSSEDAHQSVERVRMHAWMSEIRLRLLALVNQRWKHIKCGKSSRDAYVN